MPINKVHLQNFTVFKNMTIIPSDGINILIGENGTGKTHFLKTLYCLSKIRTSEKQDVSIGSIFGVNSDNLAHENGKNILLGAIDNSDELLEFSIPCNHGKNNYILSEPQQGFNAVYIPVKDMLTHSKGLLSMVEKYQKFPFDNTLTDIIRRANQWDLKSPPKAAEKILPILEKLMGGTVEIEDEEFYIKKHDGHKINFSVEAEGLKKIGLLWKLLMNENIVEGTVLLWDEPEANLNPKYLPYVVECLLELSRCNVQIFVSTHNYVFAKYFDLLRKDNDELSFHSLYKEEQTVFCETKRYFGDLKHNDITHTYNELLDKIYDLGLGE